MLERLHFVVGGCVAKGTKNSDCSVAFIILMTDAVLWCYALNIDTLNFWLRFWIVLLSQHVASRVGSVI